MSKQKKTYLDDQGEVRELDADFFKTAMPADVFEAETGIKLPRRGRPALPEHKRKKRVTIMLDPDVIKKLKQDGRGWQTRANNLLRKAVGL